MIRPRQIRLKLNKSQFQHCQQLSQESAHIWNTVKNFFWRTDPSQAQDKKGIWLSESAMKRYITGQFALHSQSIQAVIEKFYDNLKAARSLRCRRRRRTDASHADNPDIRYPYKNKNWFCVHWKKSAIKVKGRYIYLSNGKGRQGIIFKLPMYPPSQRGGWGGVPLNLASCQPSGESGTLPRLNRVELIWRSCEERSNHWLSITLEVEGKQQILGFNAAAVDMGEIHAMTITDSKEALVISGRQLRSVKRNRNKRVAKLSRLQSRCSQGSPTP